MKTGASLRTFSFKVVLGIVLMLGIGINSMASDIIQITPLTNKIILIVFDDGSVDLPTDVLTVSRLDLAAAMVPGSFSITSSDDADYSSAVNPADISRKSLGDEFKKDVPWAGNSYDPTGKPWVQDHYIYLFLDNELKAGKSYTVNTGSLAANGSDWNFTFDEKSFRSEAVHVNTIGYAADAPKYGYIYQWMGDKGGADLTEYAGNAFHVYPVGSDTPVLSGTIQKRKSATNPETGQSGDTPNQNFLGAEVYDCDFSEVTADGEYILVVEEIGSSYPFKIGDDALWEAAYAAGRSLYYQRSGIRLAPPYTDGSYIRPVTQNTLVTSDDGVSFAGKMLYSDYSYMDWQNADGGGDSKAAIRAAAEGKPLDVAGWYHDAGDWDGYFSHQRIPILLMLTYEFAPEQFADDEWNLPESGNGIPDILDEASWLIKFNYRLRKELMAKGYSDGGVGGARVCPDVYTDIDGYGNPQKDRPSWKETRPTVVSQADAFMTYLYAGQAAQFAYILRQLGKDPKNFEVEMLDHVDFESMTKDVVDWEAEAKAAYAWASAAENQPASSNNYDGEIGIYQMYAAVNLYRLTNEESYNTDAKLELEKVRSSTKLDQDERYGVYSYLLADNYGVDKSLVNSLVNVTVGNANFRGMDAAEKRALRWGGVYDMPMLVGQGTTPLVFECLVAYAVTGDKKYKDVVHTTADYFLGGNAKHSSWLTGVGPRPPHAAFHLDSRYNNDWVLYPGCTPYGQWSLNYDFNPYTWEIDGVTYEGGAGPWNKDWRLFTLYPIVDAWPGHEVWCNNIHAPMASEFTVHQNLVYTALTYGYVNEREHTNAAAMNSISSITLSDATLSLTAQGQIDTLIATIDIDDAGFAALKWESEDPRIVYVDGQGRVTAVNNGSVNITCSTLDGSVSASCAVTCSWTEIDVTAISVEPDSLTLIEGQSASLEVFFSPENATNKFVDWSYSVDGIVEVDDIGEVSTLAVGNTLVIATSLNGGKKDSCVVEVLEAVDHMIADFDVVIPVQTEPQPEVPQMYTPAGSGSVDADNPLVSPSNESAKVGEWNRPEGDWRLFGMVLPTATPQDLSKYAQFQFKYFGKGIKDFYIQLKPVEGDDLEINANVESEDAWKLFTYDLDVDFELKQFNIFANKTGNSPAATYYFDDIKLAGKPAVWYDGLSISDEYLDMSSGSEVTITADAEGEVFSWTSTNPAVVTVDQNGLVKAITKGTASILAVPLYGDMKECVVDVDGGGNIDPTVEQKMILNFENFELDWSAGYGSYAWGSTTSGKTDNPSKTVPNTSDKVAFWDRDGTNNWGGFGIQFPEENSTGWERLSFMVYASVPVSGSRVELLNVDDSQGSFQENDAIPANIWTQVVYDLDDMNVADAAFNKVTFQFNGGTADVGTFYVDNIWLEKGGEDPDVEATGISISGAASITVFTGNTKQLSATIEPDDATNQNIDWSSSNTAVATVSGSGLVSAVSVGTATITASPESDPSITASVTVTVEEESGVRAYNRGNLRIYPNPAKESFILESDAGISSLDIVNVLGEIVKHYDLKGVSESSISGYDTESGLYFLRIRLVDSTTLFSKLIIE